MYTGSRRPPKWEDAQVAEHRPKRLPHTGDDPPLLPYFGGSPPSHSFLQRLIRFPAKRGPRRRQQAPAPLPHHHLPRPRECLPPRVLSAMELVKLLYDGEKWD